MLQTKKVFLDTECFVRNNLNFENSVLTAFKKLCDEQELQHLSTTVVYREVVRKIEDSTKEALDALKTFKRKAQPLNNLDNKDLSSLFKDLDEGETYQKAINSFKNYLEECLTEIISADSINCEDILDRYFQTKPPFTKDKSNEFRDAILLSSLKDFIDGESVYVVSGDKILEQYCEEDDKLIYVDSLSKLIDLHSETNARTSKLKDFLHNQVETLQGLISDLIEDCDVYNNSTWEDAEVEEFKILSVDIDDISVLSISDEDAVVIADARIILEVTVTGPDYNNGTYDKEDGIIYTHEHSTQIVSIDYDYEVDIEVVYNYEDDDVTDANLTVNIDDTHKGIEVSVEENEQDYY